MMKPLGLEGKVGAPAIVKENPLYGLLDRYRGIELGQCRDAFSASREMALLLHDLRATFSWMDVLDVVHDEYPSCAASAPLSDSHRRALESLVHDCTGVLDEPVLVYDLDTPDLKLSVSRGLVQDRLVIANGSTRAISAGERVYVRLEGAARSLRSNGGIALLSSGTVEDVELLDRGLYVSDRGTVPNGCVILQDDSLAIVPVSQRYMIPDSFWFLLFCLPWLERSSICAPSDTAAIRSIHDRVLSAGDDPVALGDAYQEFRQRTFSLGFVPWMRQLFRPDTGVCDYLHTFTPRGGSR